MCMKLLLLQFLSFSVFANSNIVFWVEPDWQQTALQHRHKKCQNQEKIKAERKYERKETGSICQALSRCLAAFNTLCRAARTWTQGHSHTVVMAQLRKNTMEETWSRTSASSISGCRMVSCSEISPCNSCADDECRSFSIHQHNTDINDEMSQHLHDGSS